MHEPARRRILETLPDGALVLDVGGWAVPLPRADWVLDIGSYATRGAWAGEADRAAERFSADTWVQRDICDREPWPFADDQFDFVVCSHTLEDIRDPVWVCSELARVAKAGYIEVPSRLEEQSWGFQGQWTGWGHHHWLIEVDPHEPAIEFLFKHHVVHDPKNHFPEGFHAALTEEQKITQLWWEGTFTAREKLIFDPPALDAEIRDFVLANGGAADAGSGLRGRLRRRRS